MAIAVTALLAPAAVASASADPAPRTLTATPATNLGHQVVMVQWTGFHPTVGFKDTVTIVQCTANPHAIDDDRNPATIDDCETASTPNWGNKVTAGVTHADGTGSALIEILPEAWAPQIGCTESTPCSLVAFENNGTPPPTGSLPKTAAVTPITFGPTPDCPPRVVRSVRAEGEASATPVMESSATALCAHAPPLNLDYTETSSVSGRADFLSGLVDVGVTSMPATKQELRAAPGHPRFTYAPVDLTALVVAYKMDDPTTGLPIDDLVLSPRLLARVISDSDLAGPQTDPQSFWADPELNRLNPAHHWPNTSLSPPLLRAEHNADTFFATDWIAHDRNAEKFLQGDDPDGVGVNDGWLDVAYPTDIFENLGSDSAYLPLQGETTVARKLFYGVKPAETAPNDPKHLGFIGVVDLATAERFQLSIAKLVNASGTAVAPDSAAIAAGYDAMTINPDGITRSPNFASLDPSAYPIVKIDYAMVPTVVATTKERNTLRQLLAHVRGAAQDELPPGFVPLPAALVAEDKAAAAKIHVAPPPSRITGTTRAARRSSSPR